MPSINKRSFAVLVGAAISLTGCMYSTREPPPVVAAPVVGVNPYPPVPPRLAETRPLPPVSDEQLVWRIGQWEWVGSGYVWRPGEWEKLGDHSNEYLPGHWTAQGGAWVWVRGHWL